eukprot:TRINITY_DN10919_c0_g4_i2.p1 TRINITY_DN10919_c0_g4~~TRINITY_DN10919_c0_g4_i2.p1  ORF type:complete len:277 (-),score=81.89 TRINITY_DN10919_c0_g4_i2:399-1142(-)
MSDLRLPLLGVCFFPEQHPHESARRMRAAGVGLVRMGEFSWSHVQPTRGAPIDLSTFERALDALHAEGIRAVLCTPTATPPAWVMAPLGPESQPHGRDGRPREPGSRRHYCHSSEPFRAACEEIVTAFARRLGGHPAVVAWQTDNEYSCHDTAVSYSPCALRAFRVWLCTRYGGDIDKLNAAWGNTFWSLAYTTFDEVGGFFWFFRFLVFFFSFLLDSRSMFFQHNPSHPIIYNYPLPTPARSVSPT